jgi:nucleoside-diphosphate-sugar epimerase
MARVVITGGAGFLGSHLCESLLRRDDEVVCVDNLVTGDRANISKFVDDPHFTFLPFDISRPFSIDGQVDAVLNFASPASPPDYLDLPIETLMVGSIGTMHALDLARANNARFLTASTSEVYGDPHVHPQPESYWGNVNPVGPRSVYDESKRFGEALTMAYHRTYGVDTRLVRIFNTYGPQMRAGDGRVVSNFIVQALTGKPITIFGAGDQTRSFCYVEDEVRGFLALLDSDGIHDPVNIGNPNEFTILELAKIVIEVVNSTSQLVYEPLPEDDPTQRKPDITRARELLGWEPVIQLREGVERTAAYFARRLGI